VSGLVSRVLVGAIGLPIVLGVVWLGGWWVAAGTAVAALIGLHEYGRLVRALRPLVLAAYVGAVGMVLAVPLGGLEWVLGAVAATLALAFVLYGVATTRAPATVAIGATMLGAVWIGVGLAHIVLLRDLERGRLILLTVLLADFAANTAAYAAGRFVGRHKLAPVISPGKTWEGFLAGVAAAMAVAFFALYEDREEFLAIWEALLLGAVVAVAGALGDLFESTLKRDMKVKDTGRLLGGHGGMLDRVDSLLFAAPAAFYLLLALGVSAA
jgi:phosphatidate cytidylyltransferase